MIYRQLSRLGRTLVRAGLRLLLLLGVGQRNLQYRLFGSAFGFSDNSRYLFEELVAGGGTDIYWVAKSDFEYAQVESRGLPVVLIYTRPWFRCWCRCLQVFVTHGTGDVAPVLPSTCRVVNLWHGIPIKFLGFDSAVDRKRLRERKVFGLRPEYEEWDFVVASCRRSLAALMSAFRLPEDRFLKCSQPRCDWLSQQALMTRFNQQRDKMILYMPTYRTPPLVSPIAEVTRIWPAIYSRTGYRLAIKAHSLDRRVSRVESVDWMISPSELSQSGDATEMIANADCLISDYSSVILDFMITRRPILLFCPDEAEYYESVGGHYLEVRDLVGEKFVLSDIDSLVESICGLSFDSRTYDFLGELYTDTVCAELTRIDRANKVT